MKLSHKHWTQFNTLLLLLGTNACGTGIRADQHAPNSQSAAPTLHRKGSPAASKKLAPPVQFIGRDDQTRGDWQKKYGRQAFLIPMQGGAAEFQAVGVTLKFVGLAKANTADAREEQQEGYSTLIVWDKAPASHDVRLPPAANGLTTRQAVAFGGRQALAVRAEASDGKPHQLAVYLLDYHRQGLSVSINAFDGHNHLVESRRVSKYAQGAYLRYRFVGSVLLVVRSLTAPTPPILTGLFVDPAPKL